MEILNSESLKVSTKSCHAGTIAFYQDKPIYSWFGGSMEGAPDSSIYVQCDDKVHVLSGNGIPKWNPILFSYMDSLFLFFKAGLYCDRWQTFILDISGIFDSNFNINRVRTEVLPAGLNGPVKTKPIVHNGLIYCGSSVETIFDWSGYVETYMYDIASQSFVYVARTNPLTVPKVAYTDFYGNKRNSLGIIQPSLWADRKGSLNAFFRSSRGLGKIYYSHSEDDIHELWSSPKPTKFLNPNSGIDTVCHNNRLFLVYNPSETARDPLNLVELNEETFDIIDEITIDKDIPESEHTNSPELSYPFLVENDGKLHCVYTRGRSKIIHTTVEI